MKSIQAAPAHIRKFTEAARNVLEQIGHKDCKLNLIPDQGAQHLVFKVDARSGDFVARVSNEGLKGLRHQEKEKVIIKIAGELGVPVPEVYAVALVEDYAVMLQAYVPGVRGDKATDPMAVWESLGRYARIIHSIEVQGYGEDLAESDPLVFEDRWSRFISYNIASLSSSDPLITNSVLTLFEQQRVKALFESIEKTPHTFGLVHNDLSPKNAIVSDGPIVLIDWTCAEANIVPYWDVAEILANDPPEVALQAFRKGYGLSEKDFAEIVRQSCQFLLLRSCDKYRWAIDRSPSHVAEYGKTVRKTFDLVFRQL